MSLQDQLNEWLTFRSTFLDEVLRHDGLGDFLGRTECSSCQNAPGIIKCKDCPSRRILRCPECVVASHQFLPLHRVEVRTTLGQITWWLISISDGTANFSIKTLSRTLDCLIRSATLTGLVLFLWLVQNILSSSISQVLISSHSTTVTAASSLFQVGPNSCASDGFQLPFHDPKRFSPSTASNNFMNLHYKGRLICMTTITRYYDELIMLTFTAQL